MLFACRTRPEFAPVTRTTRPSCEGMSSAVQPIRAGVWKQLHPTECHLNVVTRPLPQYAIEIFSIARAF